MRIITSIPQSNLEKLSKYSKLFSYLMTTFVKTYGVIQNDKLTFYFKGNKSVVSLALDLIIPVTDPVYFSIDINKFLSAAKKIGDAMPLNLTINTSPPQILMTSDATNDKISFSANFYEGDSPEIVPLVDFKKDKSPIFTDGDTFMATPAFLDFNHISSTYMGTINKNNSIAIFPDTLVYADRTVVVRMKESVWTDSRGRVPDESCLIHRFILGFIDFVAPENPVFRLSKDHNFVQWESTQPDSFWAILAIDPCTIAIPTLDDLATITPEATKIQKIKMRPSHLADAIDFFSGLFEASVWKPITFNWSTTAAGEQKIVLSYHHPSTEIEKELAVDLFEGNLSDQNITAASFTLISDSLRTLLNRMLDTGTVELQFNSEAADVLHGAGIRLQYVSETGETVYDAVLAKLADS